jgi:hypothetical protein
MIETLQAWDCKERFRFMSNSKEVSNAMTYQATNDTAHEKD